MGSEERTFSTRYTYKWVNGAAWGVVVGTYEYKENGLTVTCPMVEVVYWNNDQEGL